MKSKPMKWTFALTAGIATLSLGLVTWGLYPSVSQRPRTLDQWEVAGREFKVRITASSDNGFPAPGVLYTFQSSAISSNDWHEIATVPTDQRVTERDGWVQFVSDRVCYAFMGSYYMVTTDSGPHGLFGMLIKSYLSSNLWNYTISGQPLKR
jgi:hypothetical protein